MKILNLGCGFNKMKNAVNVDIRKECNPDIVMDFEKPLKFKDNEFDKIVTVEVFEHIKTPQRLLKECYRILKPNGILELTVPYNGRIKNMIVALLNFDNYYSPFDDGHIKFFTPNSLKHLLRGRGFKIYKTTFQGRIKFLWSTMTMYAKCMKSVEK